MRERPPVNVRRQLAWGTALVVGLIAAARVISWVDGQAGQGDPSADVKVACRTWVKDRLKAPATADFSGEKVTAKAGVWEVTGSVDSQNSFGAQIRSGFTCVARRAEGQTTLVSLDVVP